MLQFTENFLHDDFLGGMQRRNGDTMHITHFARVGRHRSRVRSHEREPNFL